MRDAAPRHIRRRIRPYSRGRVCSRKALGLQTGLSHMEWFRLADGSIAISEVGARPPGAQFSTLLSYAHDVDFYKAWPRLIAFNEFRAAAAQVRGRCSVYPWPGPRPRRRITRCGRNSAALRLDSLSRQNCRSEGQPPSDSYEGDGYIIVRHPDTDVVQHALQEIVSTIRVELRVTAAAPWLILLGPQRPTINLGTAIATIRDLVMHRLPSFRPAGRKPRATLAISSGWSTIHCMISPLSVAPRQCSPQTQRLQSAYRQRQDQLIESAANVPPAAAPTDDRRARNSARRRQCRRYCRRTSPRHFATARARPASPATDRARLTRALTEQFSIEQ